MPKAKKLRAPALKSQQVRHEPLGQTIEGDTNRGKYALPVRGKRRSVGDDDKNKDDAYLDEKTSRRILDMTAQQQLEEDLEQQRRYNQQQRHQKLRHPKTSVDSDDEDDDEDDDDIEDIVLDEGDE